jgi:hypothetical protein
MLEQLRLQSTPLVHISLFLFPSHLIL